MNCNRTNPIGNIQESLVSSPPCLDCQNLMLPHRDNNFLPLPTQALCHLMGWSHFGVTMVHLRIGTSRRNCFQSCMAGPKGHNAPARNATTGTTTTFPWRIVGQLDREKQAALKTACTKNGKRTSSLFVCFEPCNMQQNLCQFEHHPTDER